MYWLWYCSQINHQTIGLDKMELYFSLTDQECGEDPLYTVI